VTEEECNVLLIHRIRITFLDMLKQIYCKNIDSGVIPRYALPTTVHNSCWARFTVINAYYHRESGVAALLLYSVDVGHDKVTSGMCDWEVIERFIKPIAEDSWNYRLRAILT
jgi:hypothetical protein